MMYYDNGAWHPWVAALMWAGMILFWAFVIFGVVWLVRSSGPSQSSGTANPPPPDPERILQERLARGEIDTDEYRQRLEVLRGKVPVTTK